jgi:tRNA pseudouridine55 synthase
MDNVICGYIPVNKAEGFTSFDVCAVVRRAVGVKRVGHTGTLDPMATGVLPVLVGRATLAADILPDTNKAYTASLMFGSSTDTMDSSGRVTETTESRVTLKALSDRLSIFDKPQVISQLPPMYSAVKVNGRKLYELARKGIEADRPPRTVTIYEAKLVSFDETAGTASINVRCSSGTYIRTFIDDLGRELHSLAHMTALQRTYASGVSLCDCIDILDIKAHPEEALKHLKPIETLFEKLPAIDMTDETYTRYRNGAGCETDLPDGRYRVIKSGVFIGTGVVCKNNLKAEKYFVI